MHAPNAQNSHINLDDLYSVKELAAAFPRILSVNTLQYQLRSREENGLAAACVPIGKRLLISKPLYEQWLATRTGVTPLDGALDVSTVSGIYFLIDEKGEVVYVGQSINVHARIAQHESDSHKVFSRAKVIPCRKDELRTLEMRYIAEHRPRYNRVGLPRDAAK